jgi:hypothetical protein
MARSALRPAEELLAPVVEESIAALSIKPEDAAVVRLARRYAATIDAGRELAALIGRAWDELEPDDQDGRKRLAVIEAQLADRAVMADLGPKLLAALAALGATPAARLKAKGGEPARGPSRLQILREARR